VHSLECKYMGHARVAKVDNVAKSKLRTLIRLLATRLREKGSPPFKKGKEAYILTCTLPEGLKLGPVFDDVASLISHSEKSDENKVIVEYVEGAGGGEHD